jgi:hypothetical protein
VAGVGLFDGVEMISADPNNQPVGREASAGLVNGQRGSPPTGPLRLVGFGACMITGYPLTPEVSFFNRLAGYLATTRPVEATVVSLPGFPIDRARRHLAKKVLSLHPDYVVVQFGTSDAIAPLQRYLAQRLGIRRKLQADRGLAAPAIRASARRAATSLDLVRWFVKGIVARVLRVPPRTPREVYRESVAAIASGILASGAKPIILTPFRFGDAWSEHNGKQFSGDIEQLARSMGFAAVDGRKPLRRYPVRKVLLATGDHLSAFGHEVIAKELLRVWEPRKDGAGVPLNKQLSLLIP